MAGLLLAGTIAGVAWRARALTRSGALAAVAVGTAAVAAGWSWGTLLVAFFVAASLLTRLGEQAKQRRTASIVAKGGARDVQQVLANGGPFALAALGFTAAPSLPLMAFALGALAAATADTWATEVGTLAGGTPRSIRTLRPVPAGTSGGVSVVGTLASVLGALLLPALALALHWPGTVVAGAVAGGVAGALVDSLLGATLQARRRCARCGTDTERIVHDCGTATEHAGGVAWLDNDAVNLVSGVAGGLLAALLA